MASRREDIPAIESGGSSRFLAGLTSPLAMTRHNLTYDEHLDMPMHSPPQDIHVNHLWKDPVIPPRRFRDSTEAGAAGGKMPVLEVSVPVPVVKTKATSLMNSLMLKQTQENLQKFEHQAGLTDTVYSPHKGLSTEETRFHRLADGTLPKLRMPAGDFKEDWLTTSAPSTPSVTPAVTPSVTPSVTPCVSPHSSPALSRRSWLQLSSAPFPPTQEFGDLSLSTDMGGNEGGSGGERWSFFGTRAVVQKSPTHPGTDTGTGFSLQSYFGLQKSSTIDGSQVNLKVNDPANFLPHKLEIPGMEAKPALSRPHKLKPRDMNVLTPSGF